MKRPITALVLTLLYLPPALAAVVTDATGRHVDIPDHVERVLPAGPPAAVLLAAIAPGQMLGFTGPVSDAARAELAPAAAVLPVVPRLTGHQDMTASVHALHPDLNMKAVLATPAWASLRAVRDGHAMTAPSEPFGWVEEPPSINRLLGLAWLRGSDPTTLATLFNTIVYNYVPTPAQLDAIVGATAAFKP